jgi:gliding motility-associated-like protein
MQCRATSEIGEYMQAWNYDEQGVSNGEPSKDWVFIPTSELNNNPAYSISATYPNDDLTGYSKMRVPVADFYIPLQVENYSSDNSTCPMIENETYTSIMLGDVNGNYDGSDAGMESSDVLAFNVDQAAYTNNLGEYFIEFPIVLSGANENINAIDFWMQYDLSILEFQEITAAQSNMDVHAFFNIETEYLRVTASTPTMEEYVASNNEVFMLKFKLNNPCEILSQNDFISTEVLINGIAAQSAYSFDQNTSQIEVASNTVCSLANVDLSFGESVNSQNIVSYDWNFGNGTTGSGCLTTSAIYSTSGCYNVTLAVTSNQGCTQSFTLNDIVCVDEQPVAQFAANPLSMSTINPEVTVINLSQNAVTYQWEFGDNSGQYTQESLAHTYEEAGVYIISLFAFSENGCVDSTFQTVLVEEELLFFIPNAFTPGGDKFNETFQPVFTSGFDPYRFSMVLFNRWGEIVFETNNAAIGWDGTYGGKPAPEGTYIWQVKLDNVTFDKPQIYRGHFNLLR